MFWSYIIPSNYLQPVWIQTFEQGIPQPREPSPEIDPLPRNKDFVAAEKQILGLTKKDLLEAGYQTNKKLWAQEEDNLLMDLRDNKKLQWAEISELIPGRNSKMCYSRYRRLQNHSKQIWRKADNELLLSLIDEFGTNWNSISKEFKNRTKKQIKQHYYNYLHPEIKKEEWTLDQDLKLIEMLAVHGKNWKLIEEILKGRTQNQIKNRYFGRLKRIADKKISSKAKPSRK